MHARIHLKKENTLRNELPIWLVKAPKVVVE